MADINTVSAFCITIQVFRCTPAILCLCGIHTFLLYMMYCSYISLSSADGQAEHQQ